MRPASVPPPVRDRVRLLAVDPAQASCEELALAALPELLAAGDVLVVNDAATFPASLPARDTRGRELELRLAGPPVGARARAVLFGAGDWRSRTEDRPAPPVLAPGDRISVGEVEAGVESISDVSPRLVELRFDASPSELWAALYRHGRPVQYSYLRDDLPLWSVQTVYAGRPWAAEMPSAGRPLSWQMLLALRRRGVTVAALTHASGLSSTGDPAIDAALPLRERYDVPAATVEAIQRARRAGGRVIAVGTTVVRALEGAAENGGGRLAAGEGETELRLGVGFSRRVVDGLLTGMHEPGESHFALLSTFAPPTLLRAAVDRAIQAGFRTHEFGDCCLILERNGAPARAA